MQTFRDKPALAWGFLVVALLALLASYYFFMLRPAQPSVPSGPVSEGRSAPPTAPAGGGQSVPY